MRILPFAMVALWAAAPTHFHPADEYVEVKQGTFLVGMG
jgi:hypothetical protein